MRRDEVRELRAGGWEPVLKGSRYCFLKRVTNLTQSQFTKLCDLSRYDLKIVRAYFLMESFDVFWQYSSPYWARW